jgi:predicted RND superfamily exporter protein
MSTPKLVRAPWAKLAGLTRRQLAAALLVALVATGTAEGLARTRVQTGIDSFLPSGDQSVSALNDLDSAFGGDPLVVLFESAKPKQLLDQQHLFSLLELEGQLAQIPDVAVVYGPGTVINQIAGQTQDLLAELSGRRDAIQNQAEATARAAGANTATARAAGKKALDAFDARYGPLLVQGMPAGLPTLHNAAFVDSVIFSKAVTPRVQWRFVVPNASAAAILIRPRQGLDAAASQRLVAAVRAAVAVARIDAKRTTVSGAPALVAALSTEVSRELPLLGAIGLVAVALCFLFVPWTRRRRRLLPLASTLAAVAVTLSMYGWLHRPLSLGVVAFLPVLLGIGSYYPTYFARSARPRTVLVVALGTAASFATLAISPLPFVRDLGGTLALGVVLSALVAWAATGSSLLDEEPERSRVETQRAAHTQGRRSRRSPLLIAICTLGALFAVAGWSALPGLRLQTDFERYATGLPALADATHVQSIIGSSGELDIVLRGPDVLSPAAYKWMRVAQATAIADYGDRLHPVVSVPTLLGFLGATPTAAQIAAGARFVPDYLLGATVVADHTMAVLSFGVNIADLGSVQHVISGLGTHLPPAPAGYHARIAGLPVVAARGAHLVSADRVIANVFGILAATLILAVGLRRRTDALRACATATMATGIGLFLLWFTGIALSPMTLALGALTAAVSCEFTVMLAESARSAHHRLRTSVLLAVATSTVGYLALTASRLATIRQFGAFLAGAVVLAFLCALAIVRLTCPRSTSDEASPSPSDAKAVLVGVS